MASPPRQPDPPRGPPAPLAAAAPGLFAPRGAKAAAASLLKPVDLAGLDGLAGDVLGLFCWSDVRPLRGVLGLVDWRLCGAVSRAMESNVFSGARGDTLLLPLSPRIGPKRLFVFGLGPKATWDQGVLQGGCVRACQVARLAGAKALTLGAPACLGDVQIEQVFVAAALQALGPQPEPLLVERL